MSPMLLVLSILFLLVGGIAVIHTFKEVERESRRVESTLRRFDGVASRIVGDPRLIGFKDDEAGGREIQDDSRSETADGGRKHET